MILENVWIPRPVGALHREELRKVQGLSSNSSSSGGTGGLSAMPAGEGMLGAKLYSICVGMKEKKRGGGGETHP